MKISRILIAIGLLLSVFSSIAADDPLECPSDIDHQERGLEYYQQEEFEDAIRAFSCAIEAAPQEANNYILRASAYSRLLDFDRAFEELNDVIVSFDGDVSALIFAYKVRATDYLVLADYEAAIEDLTSVVDLADGLSDPDTESVVFALALRGQANMAVSDYERAVEDLNKATDLDPDYAIAYLMRGFVYEEMGDFEQAELDWEQALALDETALNQLGRQAYSYFEVENFDRAVALLDQVIRVRPAPFAADYYLRGNYHFFAGNYQQAIDDLTYGMELSPYEPTVRFFRGRAYYELGDYERAIEDLDEYILHDPIFAESYLHRGNAHYALADFDDALEDYQIYVDFAPRSGLEIDPIALERIEELSNR